MRHIDVRKWRARYPIPARMLAPVCRWRIWMKRYVSKVIGSPVGPLTLVASCDGLAAILWKDDNPRRVRLGEVVEEGTNSILLETQRQLGEYFAGRRKVFTVK